MSADAALGDIKIFGRWHLRAWLLTSLTHLPAAWQILAINFIGAEPELLEESQRNITDVAPCQRANRSEISNATASDGGIWAAYDLEMFGNTIMTEWDLVCERDFYVHLSSSAFMVGMAVGSLPFAAISDRFGRKRALLSSLWLTCVLGVGAALSTSYPMFTALRFLLGMSVQGVMVVNSVLCTELFPTRLRVYAQLIIMLNWCLAFPTLAAAAYLIKSWRYLQLAISLPIVLTLPYAWLLPDSPHWLKAHSSSNPVITAEHNNELLESKQWERSPPIPIRHAKSTYMKRIVFMSFTWFSCSLAYFGLTLNTASMWSFKNMDPYVLYALSGATDFVSIVLTLIAAKCIGRRNPLASCLFLTSMCLISIIFVPTTDCDDLLSNIISILSIFGRFTVSSAVVMSQIMAPELFPTTFRNMGVGCANLAARIGGILAPFASYVSKIKSWIPIVTFSLLALTSGLVVLALPETKDLPLLRGLEDFSDDSRKSLKYEIESTTKGTTRATEKV